MNRADIERFAREAGATPYTNRFVEGSAFAFAAPKLDAFVELVITADREQHNRETNAAWALMCAKMVATRQEDIATWYEQKGWLLDEEDVGQAIRALGKP